MEIENEIIKKKILLTSFKRLRPNIAGNAIKYAIINYTNSHSTENTYVTNQDEFYDILTQFIRAKKIVRIIGAWVVAEETYPTLVEGYNT